MPGSRPAAATGLVALVTVIVSLVLAGALLGPVLLAPERKPEPGEL